MKRLIVAILVCASATAFARRQVECGPVGPSVWADSEATTNIVFALGDVRMSNINFTLDFDATSSNNVQVSYGTDLNGNGSLDLEEQMMTVGWDCGRWLICGNTNGSVRAGMELFSIEPATTNVHKHFVWKGVVSVGKTHTAEMSENDSTLDFGLPRPFPSWMYDRNWNLMRVTVRGVGNACERFWVKTTKIGTAIFIR